MESLYTKHCNFDAKKTLRYYEIDCVEEVP